MACKLRFIISFAVGFLVTSCAIIDDTKRIDIERVDKLSYTKLNGRYSNIPELSDGILYKDLNHAGYKPRSLWSQIDGNKHERQIQSSERQTIGVEFTSHRKVLISLYDKDSLIDQKKLRGKLKDGYFYRKPYFVGLPLFPLIYGYNTYRYRIGMKDSLLIIDHKWNFWAFAVVAGNSSKGQSHSRFKRR